MLQQYLPFTVLKQNNQAQICRKIGIVATVLTVYGIETDARQDTFSKILCCNSTYRLRY